jgi:hypothetical protein
MSLIDVQFVLLISKKITMRGAERPQKVAWTHPFLLPLQPLSDYAARQTFMDIADHPHTDEDMKQLLKFTDNMPLAVDLLAHLVDYEGCANVLARWEKEKTSLLSAGNDRKSNLDASIRLSLSSARITSGAKDLLSLLSILPDGLSDVELLQSNFPIKDIRGCKAALLANSLAYLDNKRRLRSLIPIREHIRQSSPPPHSLTHPLRKYFHSLLELYKRYNGARLDGITSQIALNLGNLQHVLYFGLHLDHPDLADTIHCIINLNSFYRLTGRSVTRLMDHIPDILDQLRNYRLEVHFLAELFLSGDFLPISDSETLIAQGISHCNHCTDPLLQCSSVVDSTFLHLTQSDDTSPILHGRWILFLL